MKFFEEVFGKDFKDWIFDVWYNFGIYIFVVNIKEILSLFELELMVLGWDKGDFMFWFEDDCLYIFVFKKVIVLEDEECYICKEFVYLVFCR